MAFRPEKSAIDNVGLTDCTAGPWRPVIDASTLRRGGESLARDLLEHDQLMDLLISLLETMVAVAIGVEFVVIGLLVHRWLR